MKKTATRRFSTLDGNPPSQQDPEGIPSHRCLILNQSFEALKSARSSTETMREFQKEMEKAVHDEGEKNEQYKKFASEYAAFSQENDISAHGMNSLMSIPKGNEYEQKTELGQESGQREDYKVVEDETWKICHSTNL